MSLISIIVPVYNEGQNIVSFYQRLKEVLGSLSYNCEMIFVNDGSTDGSAKALDELALKDERIKILEFSRNFGKEIALSAGLAYSSGKAAIMIDADLQHPPELIPQFISKWERGSKVVVGIRKNNQGQGLVKKLGSFLFYKIMNKIGEIKITPNATDYRLLDRLVVNEFNRFTERNPLTRGLIDWLGFEQDFVYFEAPRRQNGKASYSLVKLIRLAFSSFVSLSLFPLKLAGYLGLVITFFSGLLGLFIFITKYLLADPWKMHFSWPAILAVIILFLIGIVLICLGLMALYIAHIHEEVVNRPMYVLRKTHTSKQS